MNKIPVSYVITTTTKGHFDRHDIYKSTVSSLDAQIPLKNFKDRIVNIKVSEDSKEYEKEMVEYFQSKEFSVSVNKGEWKHFDASHSAGILNDLCKLFLSDINKNQYSLICEDDFQVRCYNKDLEYWTYKAISLLENYPNLMQVRIPRFTNERARIDGLKAKHNIDAKTSDGDDGCFGCNDYSNNIYFARTRDIRNALLLMIKNTTSFPMHIEAGFGAALKYFSLSETPFAILDPKQIRCGHIGTVAGQEDDLEKDLVSD